MLWITKFKKHIYIEWNLEQICFDWNVIKSKNKKLVALLFPIDSLTFSIFELILSGLFPAQNFLIIENKFSCVWLNKIAVSIGFSFILKI